jgi:exosortase A-associated hydrolase 2
MEAFFLPGKRGALFCIYHPPVGRAARGGLLHVPAFAEEMNKSRRMVAQQARRLAQEGIAVLIVDLYGCGDSAGDLAGAAWSDWHDDLETASAWLSGRIAGPIGLWGLRLGALLALDFAKTRPDRIDRIILWQPVISGGTFLNQFLRLRLAADMLVPGDIKITTEALRNELAMGKVLEVAGYPLTRRLVDAVDPLRLADLGIKGVPMFWFEVVAEDRHDLPPAAKQVLTSWSKKDLACAVRIVRGASFWSAIEIQELPELIGATVGAYS